MDYVQRAYNRSLKIVGQEGVITWSFQDNSVAWYSGGEQAWHVSQKKAPYDVNEMYIEEMRHFISCIKGEVEPLVDAHQSKHVLDIALAAKMSAEKKMPVRL